MSVTLLNYIIGAGIGALVTGLIAWLVYCVLRFTWTRQLEDAQTKELAAKQALRDTEARLRERDSEAVRR